MNETYRNMQAIDLVLTLTLDPVVGQDLKTINVSEKGHVIYTQTCRV